MIYSVKRQIAGSEIVFETGKLAKQANGAVFAKHNQTAVLVTVCSTKEPVEGIDFFPLTVEYREKFYASGKIPGGFIKRESKPSTKEILISRLIDRPIRPMFSEGFRNEVQVIATVLSADKINTPDIIAINASSCALAISDIPFEQPIGAVRVGYINNEYIINPTNEQIDKSELDMVVAGTEDAIIMVEGGAKELSEDIILKGIEEAHKYIREFIDLQKELIKLAGKEKQEVKLYTIPDELINEVKELVYNDLSEILKIVGKQERYKKTDELFEKLLERYKEKIEEEPVYELYLKDIFKNFEKEIVRNRIFNEGIRIDGRKPDEIRPISIEIDLLDCTHGSALFTRGETQSLGIVTLGTVMDEQIQDDIENEGTESFMLHYNFPPFSVGEVKRLGPPGRREIGHGHLAERAIKPLLPEKSEFPYTIRVVSEILESNGSSSMATVCSSSLALMAAGVPIKRAVSGIAMGLIKESEKYIILSDILGQEDHLGDMDFKLTGTAKGITALQMDIKIKGIDYNIMREAISQATKGRLYILEKMNEVISQPRPSIPDSAPRIVFVDVPEDKIGELIGPGGKNIKKIQEKSRSTIYIEENGKANISAANKEDLELAIKLIKEITEEVEEGQIYEGVIKRLTNYGAFVELKNGIVGLLHISQITNGFVNNIEDYLKIGQKIKVKVISIDKESNKISLSAKFE
ncbi:MAG TPA: polyribonucleotide nucleotidyltransferase [bacterium]|nr:polyribonucleotide nucleotidyltransferase [bacterium]HOL48009.1 polyribonucleotide nucleotidyltransferase [bacterium]HPQ19311.1 polyribonucleotide nucleotidyltransferase [bacterium]